MRTSIECLPCFVSQALSTLARVDAVEGSSPSFRRSFEDADLVISKGQGNYETLHDAAVYPLFFLFMVKCPIVSRHVGLEVGESLVAAQNTLHSRHIVHKESDLK